MGGSDNELYTRAQNSASALDDFTFRDADGRERGYKETSAVFDRKLPGGMHESGVMAPSVQWGSQVRYPGEITQRTAGGRELTTYDDSRPSGPLWPRRSGDCAAQVVFQ